MKRRKGAGEALTRDLAALPELPLGALKDRWHTLYGAAPPPRLGHALLVRGIAHRMQEQALGCLKPTTRRRLVQAAAEFAEGRAPSTPPSILKAGTRLLREWQGVTHEVIVLEDGVRYRGATWRSLSAVAREITGTRWSGPAFFGLRGRHDSR